MLVDARPLRQWACGGLVGRSALILSLSPLLSLSPPPQTVTAKEGIEIRGAVVGALDGRPVEGATVYLIRRTPAGHVVLKEPATTDDRGTFIVRAPAPGDYSLSASRLRTSGFGVYGGDAFSESPQQWFRVSRPTSGIVLRFWESPIVAGVVLDENDQPIEGVTVRAMQSSELGGRQILRTLRQTRTDARGAYSLQPVGPGSYLLAASAPLTVAGPARPLQYYPNARTPGAAARLELRASHVARAIDFVVRREPGFTISGAIEIPPGLLGPYVLELYESPTDGLTSDVAVARAVSKDGRFFFPPVVAGSYEIRFVRYAERPPNSIPDGAVYFNSGRIPPQRLASVPDGPTWWAAERVDIRDKDVDLSIRLTQGARVSGRVVFDGSGSKPDPSVISTRGVYLRSLDHRFFGSVQLGSPREDGSFRTVAVPPGRYVLGMLDWYDGFHLESITVGGREVAGVGFNLDRDVDDAILRFSSRATVVTGRVAGDTREKFVLMWPQEESLWSGNGTNLGRTYRAVTADGSYKLAVFPGAYRMVALPGLPPADWESREYLRFVSLSPFTREVVVGAGQTVVHNPPLAPRK